MKITTLNQSKSSIGINSLLLCLAILFSFFTSLAQEKAVGELSFETEEIDFGTVMQGENGLRAFKFTNTGDAPVVISDVKSTCGCTVASAPDAPVLPGETATIEVNYDTKRIGKFSKAITVISNARESRKVLKIIGEVKKGPSK